MRGRTIRYAFFFFSLSPSLSHSCFLSFIQSSLVKPDHVLCSHSTSVFPTVGPYLYVSVFLSFTHVRALRTLTTHKHLGCSSAGDTASTAAAAAALINDLVRCVYCMATLTECRRGSDAVNLINLSFFLFLWLARPFSLQSYRKLVFGTGARGFTNPELFPVAVPVFLLYCLDRYTSHKSNGILLALSHLCPCQRVVSRIVRCCINLWKYSLKGECSYNKCWVTVKCMSGPFVKVHEKFFK